MRIDLMAARSELQQAVTTPNTVSNENVILKNEILGAKSVIAGAQVEYQSLVAKADAANSLVCRLQNELAQTPHAASSQSGAGQEKFNSESEEAQEFARKLVDNCMAFAREQLQAMQIDAEEKTSQTGAEQIRRRARLPCALRTWAGQAGLDEAHTQGFLKVRRAPRWRALSGGR